MADFKTRLLTERDELKEKHEKLSAFLDSDKSKVVGDRQLALMRVQYRAMDTYLTCLNYRIELL